MTIAFVQAGTGASTGASVSATMTSAPTSGNLLVAFVAQQGANTWTAGTGWTALTKATSGDEGSFFWKYAGAGESTTQTPCTTSNTARAWAVIVAEYSGLDGSGPLAEGAIGDTAATKTSPSVTPTSGVTALLLGGAAATADTTTFSAEDFNGSTTGVTEQVDLGSGSGGNATHACLWDLPNVTTSGSYVTTATASVASSGTISIAIFQAAAGGGGGATVTAVAATATATATPAPTLSAGSTVTGVAATATSLAPAPVVSGGANVNAVVATATADVQAPTVSSEAFIQGTVATATATAPAPSVVGTSPDATVDAVVATATSSAVAPTVSGDGTISAVAATATATAQAPAVSGSATVAAVVATATADAGVPTVTGSEPLVNVQAVVATATAAANAPVLTSGALVVAVAALATAQAYRPVVLVIAPTFTFEPPTYQVQTEKVPLLKRPRIGFTRSMSVVRINGQLQTFQTPSNDMLTAAGVEGEDYFLGGRIYTVSLGTATELQNAGFTVT